MSVPDPQLTLEEALTVNGAIRFAAGMEPRFKNDAVLNAAHDKLHESATQYNLDNPGELDAVQRRLAVRRQLSQDD